MPKIIALHQVRVPGLKAGDESRTFTPSDPAFSVSDETWEFLKARGAARLASETTSVPDKKNGDEQVDEKETPAQRKAREKAEKEEKRDDVNTDDVV